MIKRERDSGTGFGSGSRILESGKWEMGAGFGSGKWEREVGEIELKVEN